MTKGIPKIRRQSISLISGLVLMSLISINALAQSSSGPDIRYSPDTVLVKFVPGTPGNIRAQAHSAAGGQQTRVIPGLEVAVIRVPVNTVERAVNAYQRNPNVLYAEPNFRRTFYRPSTTEGAEPGLGIANNFNEQWGLDNTGQAFGVTSDPLFGGVVYPTYQAFTDADIDAPEGWLITHGSPAVTIAILDSGVTCTHLDLTNKCIDETNYVASYGSTLEDVLGHGSHVAGIAAAIPDNGIGIAGVAWESTIAALKVCYEDRTLEILGIIVGQCEDADIAAALSDVVMRGYQVVNMSFAGPDPSTTLQTAVDSAWNAGVLMVAAAGNNYTNTPQYPAAYSNVLSVGSTDYLDNLSSFSSFGDWVSVLAPGTAIVSTAPGGLCGQAAGVASDCYDTKSGTSMAAPHVAGLAALLIANTGQDNQWVRGKIESTTDTEGVMGQNMLAWAANGRINMATALAEVSPPFDDTPTVTLLNPNEGSIVRDIFSISANAADDIGVTGVEFFVGGNSIGSVSQSPYSVNWDSALVANGAYIVSAIATDTIGQFSSDSINITVDNVVLPTTTHIADIDGSGVSAGRGGKWNATVSISVQDSTDATVADATIIGNWSTGSSGTCITDGNGTCSMAISNINKNTLSVSFIVTSVSHATYDYVAGDNADPDGDSDGTTIIVVKP